ncbi:hypothetical protein Tsp_07621 [Trichinella spiralis]|uniref:hypothetical protein n=1 Tax=Trichinella spiralis TaxID=6334 RepID=UPI0001EFC21E|nr:hypothetical protein Tsp_07621 [Trichinella spiralis]
MIEIGCINQFRDVESTTVGVVTIDPHTVIVIIDFQWKTSNVEDLLNYLNCDCLSNRIFTASNTEKHCITTTKCFVYVIWIDNRRCLSTVFCSKLHSPARVLLICAISVCKSNV